MKIIFLTLVFSLFFSPLAYCNDDVPSPYESLIRRLSEDGFEREFLLRLFIDSRAEINPATINPLLVSKENPDLYDQFLKPESILLSKNFLRKNLTILRQMEKEYQVDKEVVVAILLVESNFGQNIGKNRVISTLASIVLIDSAENLQKTFMLLKETSPELSYESLESLAKRKANWAYQELKCFLNIVRNEQVDPLEVYGSYAGALGMAQFIPSSYVKFALSRKGLEGWLLNKEEAIFSIGNYLKCNGWKKDLPLEKKRAVIWSYNRSDPYIETILKVAQKLQSN